MPSCCFPQILIQDPSHAKAAYSRGACHNMKGDIARAVDDYTHALAHDHGAADLSRKREGRRLGVMKPEEDYYSQHLHDSGMMAAAPSAILRGSDVAAAWGRDQLEPARGGTPPLLSPPSSSQNTSNAAAARKKVSPPSAGAARGAGPAGGVGPSPQSATGRSRVTPSNPTNAQTSTSGRPSDARGQPAPSTAQIAMQRCMGRG